MTLIFGKMSRFKRFGAVMALAAFVILITIFENLSVGIAIYEVEKGLPGDSTLRIVQLSDIHMILNNRTAAIEKAGVIYNLLGVQDPATLYKEPRYAHVKHKTGAILTDLLSETGDADLNILLSHRPELFDVYTDEFRIDLTRR